MHSKTLYILRGTPGSGKSTLAPKIARFMDEIRAEMKCSPWPDKE